MEARLGRLRVARVQVVKDGDLADKDARAVDERRDSGLSRDCFNVEPLRRIDWRLVDEIVETEFGQALSYSMRGRAPLGLVELEHRPLLGEDDLGAGADRRPFKTEALWLLG
jgi:hypothetical protein